VPRARGDRRSLPCPGGERAHRRPVPRRRLRLEVVHEDGAADGRARAEGGPACADPEPRRLVDGDDAPAPHALAHADGRDGRRPPVADLIGDVEKDAAAVGWGEPKPPLVGRGVSVGLLAAGAHPVSSAVCRLEADGRVVVLVGTTEMGQGPRTAFAQIAAEEIGVEPEQVTVRGADTRFTPYDRSTGASRSTTVAGLAVQ